MLIIVIHQRTFLKTSFVKPRTYTAHAVDILLAVTFEEV